MFNKVTRQTANYINRLPSFPHYAEEGQDLPIKFQFYLAVPDHTYVLLHGPVKCRDFLGDVICSEKFSNSSSIYGFYVNWDKWYKDTFEASGEVFGSGLKVTFPSAEKKQNFLSNWTYIFELFGWGKHSIFINDYLNCPTNEMHIQLPHNINPVGLSWLTFLIKIAAHDIQNHTALTTAGSVTTFVQQFTSIYSGKDAGYFSRVDLDLFQWMGLVCGLTTSSKSFEYLAPHKDNISFLHNNSGFFSQFNKHHTGEFANIVGTLINDLEQPVPFKYTPLSDEQRSKYLHKVSFAFYYNGTTYMVDSNKASAYKLAKKEKTISQKYVDMSAPTPVMDDQLLAALQQHTDTPEEDSIATANFAWTTAPTPQGL